VTLGDALDQLVERRVGILFDQGRDEFASLRVEAGPLTTAVRFRLDRSCLAMAPQQVHDEGSADIEPLGQAPLATLTALVRFEDLRP
jgi:hypothetical protein